MLGVARRSPIVMGSLMTGLHVTWLCTWWATSLGGWEFMIPTTWILWPPSVLIVLLELAAPGHWRVGATVLSWWPPGLPVELVFVCGISIATFSFWYTWFEIDRKEERIWAARAAGQAEVEGKVVRGLARDVLFMLISNVIGIVCAFSVLSPIPPLAVSETAYESILGQIRRAEDGLGRPLNGRELDAVLVANKLARSEFVRAMGFYVMPSGQSRYQPRVILGADSSRQQTRGMNGVLSRYH